MGILEISLQDGYGVIFGNFPWTPESEKLQILARPGDLQIRRISLDALHQTMFVDASSNSSCMLHTCTCEPHLASAAIVTLTPTSHDTML